MKKLFALIAFASLISTASNADTLGTDISRVINAKAKIVLRDTVLFGGRTDFLPNLTLIPSFTAPDDQVFDTDVLHTVPGGDPIDLKSALLSALSNVEIGKISIPETLQTQIDEANKLLYDNVETRTKTNAFVKYEEFAREYDDLLQQIETEQNPARQTNLRNRLARLDRDWKTFGQKVEIERALELTRDTGPSNTQELLDDLIERLEGDNLPPAIGDILKTAAGTSWVQVLESGDQISDVDVSISFKGQEADVATGFTLLEYVVTLSTFSFDPFSHEFFGRRDWRLKDGASFSNGIIGDNGDNEILSQYVGGVVLISDIRLSAPQDVIDGMDADLQSLSAHRAYIQRNSIKLPSYYIAGVVVVDAPKTPDPLPNVEWE